MQFKNKKQLLLLSAAFVVLVGLFLAPRIGSSKTEPAEVKHEDHQHPEYAVAAIIDSAKKHLLPEDLILVKQQEGLLQANATQSLDSLVKLWLSFRFPAIAAHYTEELAVNTNDAKQWSLAGSRYYAAAKFGKPDMTHIMFDKAINCFNKSSELDPSNLDVKTNLGICYVEGTNEPMKGITMLKEVVSTDSTNVSAHLNLALFAIQSAQYDKAIERFNRILSINPGYIEAYLYLGQTYASQGNKVKAAEVLEKYKTLSNDGLINAEIDKYIKDLKNS